MKPAKLKLALSMLLILGGLAVTTPAQAQNWNNNRPYYHDDDRDRSRDRDGDHDFNRDRDWGRRDRVSISRDDKDLLVNYIARYYQRHCNRANGQCLRPTTIKYRVGRTLPRDIEAVQLPFEILRRIHTPRGYYYLQTKHDVILVSRRDNRVVDDVTIVRSNR